MKSRLSCLLLCFVAFSPAPLFAQDNICIRELSPPAVTTAQDGTDNFIAYVAMLLEENIIGEVELKRLMEGQSPIAENEALVSSAKLIHRTELERQLQENQIDLEILKAWAARQFNKQVTDKVERADIRLRTEVTFRFAKFHDIPTGKFIMGEDFEDPELHVEVELTKAFQMSEVLVTQWFYSMVMGENPAHFNDGMHKITANINGKSILMQPDNPVEHQTWNDAMQFIGKLNEWSKNDDNKIYIVLPDHVRGATYALPSEAQWEFVVRNLGEANGRFGAARSESKLADYAWWFENSDYSTHPVAEKLPMIINGHPFYDLLGNVPELCLDTWNAVSALRGGKDPLGTTGGNRAVRGGGFFSFVDGLRVYKRNAEDPDSYGNNGFRLIRYLP